MKHADKTKMSALAKTCLLILLCGVSAPAMADGTSVGGGANSIQGELVDKVIFENKWDPKSDPSFQEFVVPTLKYIRQNLPHLADDLELILSKRWYKPNNRIAVNTGADVALVSDQMAFQDKNAIFVDGKEFDKASSKVRGNMIMHELFQGLRVEKWLRANKDVVGGTSVAILSQEIFERTPKSAEEMQDLVARYLQNTYGTTEQVAKHQVKFINVMAKGSSEGPAEQFCTQRKYVFFGQLLAKVRGWPLSEGERVYFQLETSSDPKLQQKILFVPANNKEALENDMWRRSGMAMDGGPQGDGFYRKLNTTARLSEFCDLNTTKQEDGSVIVSKEFRLKKSAISEDGIESGPLHDGSQKDAK